MNYKCKNIVNDKDIAEIKELKIKGKGYTDINYQVICKNCKKQEKPN